MGQPTDNETQVELDDDSDGNLGEDVTADMQRGMVDGMRPVIVVHAEGATIAADTAEPIVPPPPGSLSLEQYAWIYARQLAGADELAAALSEMKLTADNYAAWRAHWESRMMHHNDERMRWFALVAKLRP